MTWPFSLMTKDGIGVDPDEPPVMSDPGMKNYFKPEIEIFEVAVEGGYGDSVLLPGFGSESDELVY